MRGIRLACVLLCLSVGCSSGKPFATTSKPLKSTDHEMQFEMARANETDGQLAKAETAYRTLCESKPKVARYHQRRGVVLTRMGQRKDGLAELEQARQLEPSNTNILNDLGYALLQSGEPTQAAELFQKTLEIDPQNTRANNNLALAMGYEGDLKESYRIFQSTMPEAEALSNLGYLATQNGKTDLAVKAYSRALTLEPEKRSAAEALTQLALLDQDIEQTRSIANDLNSVDDNSSEAPEEFPLNPAAPAKSKKVSVSHNAARMKSVSPTTVSSTSAKVLLSERDE